MLKLIIIYLIGMLIMHLINTHILNKLHINTTKDLVDVCQEKNMNISKSTIDGLSKDPIDLKTIDIVLSIIWPIGLLYEIYLFIKKI